MFCRSCYYMSVSPSPPLRGGYAVASSSAAVSVGSPPAVFGSVDAEAVAASNFRIHEGGGKVGNSAFRVPSISICVCRTFFLDLFSISSSTLARWTAAGSGRCATPPLRANLGLPAHNLKTLAADRMVRFLRTFAEEFGQPWPVYHTGSHTEEVIYYLPPSFSMRELWRLYNASVEIAGSEWELAWSTFETIYNSRTELVSIKTQRRDHNCCSRCAALKLSLDRSRDDSEHRRWVESEVRAHLALVNAMVEEKRAAVEKAAAESQTHSVIEVDFKSSIKIPHTAEETSDQFQPFTLHGLDVNVLGVYDHGRKRACIILYQEGSATDSNFTIAGVHAYFKRVGNVRHVVAYFDSCSGQNRNQNMVRYLAGRVCKGYQETITMRFFPVGHTHATVDALFGWVDRSYKLHDAFTADELIQVINSATSSEGSTPVEASFLQATEIADYWAVAEHFENAELRIKKDPITEIRFERTAAQGVAVTVRMANGSERQITQEFITDTSHLPDYEEIRRVSTPNLSLQRRRALADAIIPAIPMDRSHDERVMYWRTITTCRTRHLLLL